MTTTGKRALTLTGKKAVWQIISLMAVNFSQAVMLTTPFVMSVYMVKDFMLAEGQAVDEKKAGRMAGILAAVFSGSQFCTSIPMALASNRFGRKPIVVLGNATSLVALMWFGLSPSFGWALAARAFGGCMNGIIGAWKCMIGESCDPLLQGKVFGYMSLAWGMGAITGPTIGGMLSKPCLIWSGVLCGPGELLSARPYFLPCLIGSLTITLALVLSIWCMQETLPALVERRAKYDTVSAEEAAVNTCGEAGTHTDSDDSDDDDKPGSSSPRSSIGKSKAVDKASAGGLAVADKASAGGLAVADDLAVASSACDDPNGQDLALSAADVVATVVGPPLSQTATSILVDDSSSAALPAGRSNPAGNGAGASDIPVTTGGERAWEPGKWLSLNGLHSNGPAPAATTPGTLETAATPDLGVWEPGGPPDDDRARDSGPAAAATAPRPQPPVPSTSVPPATMTAMPQAAMPATLAFAAPTPATLPSATPAAPMPATLASATPQALSFQLPDTPDRPWRGEPPSARVDAEPSIPPVDAAQQNGGESRPALRQTLAPTASIELAHRHASQLSAMRAGALNNHGVRPMRMGRDPTFHIDAGVDTQHASHPQRVYKQQEMLGGCCQFFVPPALDPPLARGGAAQLSDAAVVAAGAAAHRSAISVDDPSPATSPLLSSMGGRRRKHGLHVRLPDEDVGMLGSPQPPPSYGGSSRTSPNASAPTSAPTSSAASETYAHDAPSAGRSLCQHDAPRGSQHQQQPEEGDAKRSSGRHVIYVADDPDADAVDDSAPLVQHHTRHHQRPFDFLSRWVTAFVASVRSLGDAAAHRSGDDDDDGACTTPSGRSQSATERRQAMMRLGSRTYLAGVSPFRSTNRLLSSFGRRLGSGFSSFGRSSFGRRQQPQAWTSHGDDDRPVDSKTPSVSASAASSNERDKLLAGATDSRSSEKDANGAKGLLTGGMTTAGGTVSHPPWHKQRNVVLALSGYGVNCFIFCSLDELFPIYAAAPIAQGGLAMSSHALSIPLIVSGCVLMLFSVWGFPPLQARFGTLRVTRCGLLGALLSCALLPLVNTVSSNYVGEQVLLFTAVVIRSLSQTSSFTGSIILVNASPPREQLGAVNGVGQAMASLARAIGPALAGFMWALSLSIGEPNQQFLTFGIIAVVILATLVIYSFMKLKNVV